MLKHVNWLLSSKLLLHHGRAVLRAPHISAGPGIHADRQVEQQVNTLLHRTCAILLSLPDSDKPERRNGGLPPALN